MKRFFKYVWSLIYRGILKPLGHVVSAIYLLAGRPWVWGGWIPPADETKRLPLPTHVAIVPHMLLPVFLIGIQVVGLFVLIPKWLSDFWIVNLMLGFFTALLVTSFNDDLFSPWWRKRYMRRVQQREILEIPDRSLDAVMTYRPGDVIRMSKECRAWAKENLKGKCGLVPINPLDFHERKQQPRVWFTNRDDAFAFKIRWL